MLHTHPQMMDGLRYLVVWNPIIFTALSFLLHLFGPHRRPGPPGAHVADALAGHVGHDGHVALHGVSPIAALAAAANATLGANATVASSPSPL